MDDVEIATIMKSSTMSRPAWLRREMRPPNFDQTGDETLAALPNQMRQPAHDLLRRLRWCHARTAAATVWRVP